jgi:hypothetical protein
MNGRKIKMAAFALRVCEHYEANQHFDEWTLEDSIVYVAEEVDLADLSQEQYEYLTESCRRMVGRYILVES